MSLQRRLAQLEKVSRPQSRPAPRVYTQEEWEAANEMEKADGDVIIVVSEKALTLDILSGKGTD